MRVETSHSEIVLFYSIIGKIFSASFQENSTVSTTLLLFFMSMKLHKISGNGKANHPEEYVASTRLESRVE